MQLTIRVPDEQMKRIEAIAQEMSVKKSDVTRMAIKKFIDEFGEDKMERPFNRIKHLLGVAESGVPELGQRHREHLIRQLREERE